MEKESMLDQLRFLDDHILADVVRQDQHCPDFVVTSWQVDRLSAKGMANPDGLFRFNGTGYDAVHQEKENNWTVVLKIIKPTREVSDITNIWYWKRELLAFESGILDDLPAGGVKAPRFYGTSEQNDTEWIWMEYIQENDPPRWPLKRFPDAAYRLGRLNGAYLNGKHLPDHLWLCRDHGVFWAKEIIPDEMWDHPMVRQIFSAENRNRWQRLRDYRERLINTYFALPQVFSHGDAGRRNHLFQANEKGVEEMVSIDWAWCGIAPIGWDLSQLLVDSASYYEMEPEDLPLVERTAIPAYLDGLSSSGWQGDISLVRLGYCVSATMFPLMPVPRFIIYWSRDEMQQYNLQSFGCRFEELMQGWPPLIEHLLDLGEEALTLMNEMPQVATTA